MKQQTLSDMEYSYRKKKTKREEFLEIMEEIIPWDEWVGVIRPYYPAGQAVFDAINRVMAASGHIMKGGTIMDATIIDAPSSTKNAEKKRDPEMHSTKKGNQDVLCKGWINHLIHCDCGSFVVICSVIARKEERHQQLSQNYYQDRDMGEPLYLQLQKLKA